MKILKEDNLLSSKLGPFAIMLAASLWAIDGLFLRHSLYKFDVFVVVFLEHLIAFIIMSFFLFPKFKEILKIKQNEWYTFGLIALFGGAIGTIAITKAFFAVFAGEGSLVTVLLLQKLQPVFAIILAIILLKEKPSKNFYLWTGLAFVGSYILTFGFAPPVFSMSNVVSFSAFLAIVAAFSFGISTVFGRSVLNKVSFEISTYLRFGLTVIIAGLFVLIFGKVGSIGAVDFSGYKTLLIIALTTGGTAIFIYYYGLKRVRASSATLYELAFPIVAIIGDWIITGKFMGFTRLGGAILLVVAITALALDKHKYEDVKG